MNLGLKEFFKKQITDLEKDRCARIVSEEKNYWVVQTISGENFFCRLPGKLRKKFETGEEPGVGDWVIFSNEKIGIDKNEVLLDRRLDRFSFLKRKAAGETENEQLMAANIDIALIVMSMNQDFNIRRLERYLTICREGNVTPILILSKSDLAQDRSKFLNIVQTHAKGIAIYETGIGSVESFSRVQELFTQGLTGVVIGSSGVGKSTLINFLLGSEVQKTFEIREGDDKGRHTTTSRSLHLLTGGGMVIDTPGLRELQIIADMESLLETFPDIEALSQKCKFSDCEHDSEPKCAVKAALEIGQLEASRLDHFKTLKAEIQRREKRKRGY